MISIHDLTTRENISKREAADLIVNMTVIARFQTNCQPLDYHVVEQAEANLLLMRLPLSNWEPKWGDAPDKQGICEKKIYVPVFKKKLWYL